MSKKIISAALTATTVFWAMGIAALPLANAQSTASLQAQIAALLAQITALQAQLGTVSTGSTSMAYDFTTDLTVGSTGADVSALQQILINAGDLTAVSAPTGYFGSLTQAALAKYQAANGISPAAGYFGPITRAFLASNSVSTGTTTTGTGTGTGTGTVTAPATGLSVSWASDNPVAGSLISSASGLGAARVPVLGVNLTAGNSGAVTITGINFHKTGVLADSAISGAYLVQNGQVVAQYSSINQGVISFSSLNLSVPAGQTADYQLAIDVAGGLSAGNTTGFSLNSASDITAWDTNNTAVTPVGAFPFVGNTFTVTQVSNPSLGSLTITTSSIGTSVTAGTQGNIVGAFNFQPQNNSLWLKGITFRVIGSANMANIQNVKLLINGTQAGATLSSVAANGTAYFNLAATPVLLSTGSNNIQIQADITGSPSYTFQFEVLNSYDVYAIDSQYNVPVSITLTDGSDSVVTIQAGQITTAQDSSTPTGNIAKGISQATLAKFDMYAAGEPTKVRFLGFELDFTGVVTSTGMTSISNMVKNITLTDDAGNQVGTTINTPPTSNTCDASGSIGGYTTGAGNGVITSGTVNYVDCFGTSSSNINYIIPANTTRVLSLKADIQSTADFSTVSAQLLGETDNLQGQISSKTNSSSGASGSALTLSNSSLSVTQNTAFGTQVVSAGSANQEIGSYSLSASSAEGVNVSTISILTTNTGLTSNQLQNLKLMVNGVQFGTTQPTVGANTTYTFSGNQFNVPEGSTVSVNVMADIVSGASITATGGVTSLSGISATGATSNSSISLVGGAVAGQGLSTGGASTITVTANSGANPAIGPVAMGTNGNTLAAFNFQETSNIENVKVTTLYVVDSAATTSATTSPALPSFNSLTLWNGATQIGTTANYVGTTTVGSNTNAYLYQFQFGNSSPFVIPRNGTLSVTLKGNANAYTNGNVTDGSNHTFQIATTTTETLSTTTVVALGNTSNAPSAVTLTAASGNAQQVLQNVLTFSAAQNGAATGRSKSASDELAILTFTPSNNGSAQVTTTTVTFSGSAVGTSTAASSTLVLIQGGGFGHVYAPTASTSCSSGTCTATWVFTSPNGVVNGSPVQYALVLNETGNGTVAASGQNYVNLYATIAASTSIQYTDGTSGTTVSGVGLPTSLLYPIQIFGAQFAQGS